MTEREKIAARIRALLAKTVENGCTEDEAVQAAAKAAELLAKYNLTVDEVRLRENPFERQSTVHDDAVGERLWKVAAAISELTEVRYWVSPRGVWPIEINFFGFDHEVQIAGYLLRICRNAMLREEVRLRRIHLLKSQVKQRQIIHPFLDGMADSLHRRIRALKPPRPTGKGLVVLRNELIDAALKDEGMKLKQHPMRDSRDFESSYRSGVEAGDRVALNQGVRGPADQARRLSGRN